MNTMLPRLPWTRYWYPREESITYTTTGFLPDPTDQWEKYVNPSLKRIEELDEVGCLVFLGEAGSGKTAILEGETLRLQEAYGGAGMRVIFQNLGNFGSEASLFRNLFDSQLISEWRATKNMLYLLLDAFDEALIDLSSLGGLLEEEIKKWPRNQLKLRISCRPAVWQSALEHYFRSAFENKDFGVYNLAPLTEKDVLAAAKAIPLGDPNRFVQEVVEKSVTAFAIRPVTLKMLLAIYQKDNSLPQTQAEIYRKGCYWLCQEQNPSRIDKQRARKHRPDQLVLTAQFLAAACIYGQKPAISVAAIDPLELSEAVLEVNTLDSGDRPELNDSRVRETLDTALFSASGAGRVSWAHRSYGEFLAAEWCRVNEVPAGQIFNLLTVRAGKERRIPSQMIQPCAWLAEITPDIRDLIMEHDPRTLLSCDPAVVDSQTRQRLVAALLNRYESREETQNYYRQFRIVNHAGIDKQLRPYIALRSKSNSVRQIAMTMATVCSVKELDPELRSVALDTSEPRQLRIVALAALAEVASDETRVALRPLVLRPEPDDVDDEIKGWALHSIWPTHLSADELFHSLQFPKNLNFHGGYGAFLHSFAEKLPTQLTRESVPSALDWAACFRGVDIDSNAVGWVSDAVVRHAWEFALDTGVLQSLSRLILSRLDEFGKIMTHETLFGKKTGPSFSELLASNSEKRRALLLELLPELAATNRGRYLTFHYEMILGEDAEWLIEEQLKHVGAEKQLLLDWLNDLPDQPLKQSAILQGLSTSKLDRSFTSSIYIELDSPLAKHLRAQAEERARERKPRKRLEPPPEQRVENSLKKSESGNVSAWIQLSYDLNLAPDSTEYPSLSDVEMKEFAGWVAADDPTRQRILKAALGFVTRVEPVAFDFVGTNSYPYWASAEYKALLLAFDSAPEKLRSPDRETTRRWAVVGLSYPFFHGRKAHGKLISYLSVLDLVAFSDALSIVLREEAEKGRDCHTLSSNLEYFWGPASEAAILAFVVNNGLGSSCSLLLLKRMLGLKSHKAQDFALGQLTELLRSSEESTDLSIELAAMLLSSATAKSWKVIWPLFDEPEDFGSRVIAFTGDEASFTRELNDDELADFYIWLEKRYPVDQDPLHVGGAYAAGDRESMAYLRSSVLTQIRQRGAEPQFKRIMKQFPNYDWLHWHRNEARDVGTQKSWVPPEPDVLVKLAEIRTAVKPQVNESAIALSFNILANVVLWFVPSDLTRLEKSCFLGSIASFTFYLLFFRVLRAGNRAKFWLLTLVVLLVLAANVSYVVERWLAQ